MTTATAPATPFIMGMRDAYFTELYRIFQKDKKAVFLSADNGAPTMDVISAMPGQFRNVGIAEEQMVGMACGLALEGRKVWIYAINPFIVFRALEFLKLDMCVMNLPITAIGIGAGFAYEIMGPTHHSVGSIPVLRCWPNLTIYNVADGSTAAALPDINYGHNGPQYVLLDRLVLPDLYTGKGVDFREGLAVPKKGDDGYIIAHGIMVHEALKAARYFEAQGISLGVIDLFRLKPVNEKLFLELTAGSRYLITLEEEYVKGGMGSIIAEIFVDRGITTPLLRIGQPDNFVFDMGGREVVWRKNGLDERSVRAKIAPWLRHRR